MHIYYSRLSSTNRTIYAAFYNKCNLEVNNIITLNKAVKLESAIDRHSSPKIFLIVKLVTVVDNLA